jgi:hypothetical protein
VILILIDGMVLQFKQVILVKHFSEHYNLRLFERKIKYCTYHDIAKHANHSADKRFIHFNLRLSCENLIKLSDFAMSRFVMPHCMHPM